MEPPVRAAAYIRGSFADRKSRYALRKRAHYRSYAAGTVSFTESARSLSLARATVRRTLSRAFTFSRRVSSGVCATASFSPVRFSSLARAHIGRLGLETSRDALRLAGRLLRQKKAQSRAKSVDNLNYISHHNPRAG